MAKPRPEQEFRAIEAIVSAHPEGIALRDILAELPQPVPRRTLQHRLGRLVSEGRLARKGDKRGARYLPPAAATAYAGRGDGPAPAASVMEPPAAGGADEIVLSKAAAQIRDHVRKPIQARKPVGYNRAFLDGYGAGGATWLSEKERAHLLRVATPPTGPLPAGTYARQILYRLLIDLSWNSSRLEGNTYSLLDTNRLINFGEIARDGTPLEAQMILNHKDAIRFLVDAADQIGFNRYTILSLHALLAGNLLADPSAPGRLRHIEVGIGGSVYLPLAVPQLVEECFDQILATAAAITDPFEQALFAMVHLPYLQPFEDVNKRVSRLAANIPLVKANLTPLSFIDVPVATYTEAILGVYELNRVDLFKELFIWACERSAARYAAVQQVIGDPDPFRLKHRAAMSEVVRDVVLGPLGRSAALAHIKTWTHENIPADDRGQFREVIETEVLALHEGNFARYRISPSEFSAWQAVWNPRG